jgi:hypothetical protein
MEGLVLKAASELGIAEHATVTFQKGSFDPVVTVAYPPDKGVTVKVDGRFLMEESLAQMKIVLGDMDKQANWEVSPTLPHP